MFDLRTWPYHFASKLSRRGTSIFLVVSGIALFLIWLLLSILPALLKGQALPEVESYTTIITFALDMAIIAPALFIAGRLFQQRTPFSHVLAPTLLVFTDVLGISLLVMGIAQQMAGLMNFGQFIGFVVSFGVLTLFSLWFSVAIFRNIADQPSSKEGRIISKGIWRGSRESPK